MYFIEYHKNEPNVMESLSKEGMIDQETLHYINIANICERLHKLPSEVEKEKISDMALISIVYNARSRADKDRGEENAGR